MLTIQFKALPLFLLSAIEIVVPFVRSIILTHFLVPYEFGFASALAATYSTFEQITDIAVSRFVSSAPGSAYVETVDAAHAMALLRGFCVAALLFLASPTVSCTLATCGDWPSFAWLAAVTVIGSFVHFEISVVQRDYRYWPQLVALATSYGCGSHCSRRNRV